MDTGRPTETQTRAGCDWSTLRANLYRYACRMLHDPDGAEDVCQETLLRCLEILRTRGLPPGCDLGAYATGVARHVVEDVHRRRRRERAFLRAGAEAPPVDFAEPLAGRLWTAVPQGHWAAALRALSRREADMIQCCFAQGLTCAEIAERRGVPASRVRKQKQRALEKLRQTLSNSPTSKQEG